MTTKLPPSLIADGTPNTILGTNAVPAIIEYPNTILDGTVGYKLVWINTTTIQVQAGTRASPAGVFILAANMNKNLNGTWVAGNNQGALVSGVRTINTPYSVYIIRNNTTYAVDVLVSPTVSPTPPVGWTLGPRVGNVYTNASNEILEFIQLDKAFYYKVPPLVSYQGADQSNVNAEITMNPVGLPIDGRVTAFFMENSTASNGGMRIRYIRSPADPVPTIGANGMWDARHTEEDMNSQINFSLSYMFPSAVRSLIFHVLYNWTGPGGAGGRATINLFTAGYIDHDI